MTYKTLKRPILNEKIKLLYFKQKTLFWNIIFIKYDLKYFQDYINATCVLLLRCWALASLLKNKNVSAVLTNLKHSHKRLCY